jgi:serine/threonine protein kinase
MVDQLGRYEIMESIGEGGFAIVYRGRDTTLGRSVALKELRPLLLQDKSWVMRFEREARTIARLDHPHIVPIYDIYEANDRLFIVMRLVDSDSLEGIITRQGPLSWEQVVQTFIPVCAGLNYAHTNGILHRDLKPANILMDPDRGPMLSDFGLAKIMGDHSMSMTESGSIVGTPHYIAPEVWEGKGTTHQSDIYALGCILYEMVTGEKIFKGETPPAVMMAHFKPLTLPTSWPAGVPAGIAGVLTKALAHNPVDRYYSAAEMAEAVHQLAPGLTAYPITGLMEVLPRQAEQDQAAGKAHFAESMPPESAQSLQPEAVPGGGVPTQVAPPGSTDEPALTIDSPAPVTALLPPSAAPEPLPAPGRQHSGCLRRSMLTGLAIFLVIFIAVGSFCAAAGDRLTSNVNFAAPIESLEQVLSDRVQIGESMTEDVIIPIPEDDEGPFRVEIEVAADEFRLTSTNKDVLIEGTASYNVTMLKPDIVINGRNIRLGHVGSTSDLFILLVYDFFSTDVQNSWDLRLGATPMALSLNTGTAEAFIELENIALTDLAFNQGAATNLDLHFTGLNALEMNTLDFNSGPTRRVIMTGLANTRARNFDLTASGGGYTLDFSGELMADMKVTLRGGNGNFLVIVPENVRAEFTTANSEFLVDVADKWEKQSDSTFVLPGTGDEDAPKITFEVLVETGDVKLRNQ